MRRSGRPAMVAALRGDVVGNVAESGKLSSVAHAAVEILKEKLARCVRRAL